MPLGDSWLPKEVSDLLRPSLVERANKRKIVVIGENSWLVLGREDLGDKYPDYKVTKLDDGTYACDCFGTDHGESRRAKGCSHITKALLLGRGEAVAEENLHTPDKFAAGKKTGVKVKWVALEEKPKVKVKWFPRSVRPLDPAEDESVEGDGEVKAPPPLHTPSPLNPAEISTYVSEPPMPAKFATFRADQWDALNEITEAFDSGFKIVMVDAPTGCLAGDSMIGINRAGKGFQISIADLVHKFNGGRSFGGKYWTPTIPTQVQIAVDGVMKLGKLKAAYESGEKITYSIRTEGARTLRATAEHPFLTPEGWVKLSDLEPGSEVHVLARQGGKPLASKNWYLSTTWLGSWRHVQFQTDVVTSIVASSLPEMTYDLELEAEPHNFIANQFVVHNSGKTLLAESARRQLGFRAMYTCTTKSLQKQVLNDYGEYAKVIQGRANYPTLDDPEATADDCTKKKSSLPACVRCPTWQAGSSWNISLSDPDHNEPIEDDSDDSYSGDHCINCFVVDTQVEWPDLVTPMRRWYEGSLVEVTTAAGHKLSGTPDHPILTDRGWIKLGLLKKGDRVISRDRSEKTARGYPDIEHTPTTLGEAYSAAAVAASIANEGIASIDMYLNVERLHPEIEVVPLDRLLKNGLTPSLNDPRSQEAFAFSYPSLRRLITKARGQLNRIFGPRLPANSIMSSGSILSPLVRGHLRHTVGLSLTTVPNRDSGLYQQSLDDVFADAESLGQGDHRFPFQVEPDEIVEISQRSFSGHVYNLETEQNWYLANDIVVHNCHPVSNCPYLVAKREAGLARLAILNTAYLLAESAYNYRTPFKEWPLVIIDEADKLEDELMNFVEVSIGPRLRKTLGVGLPKRKEVDEAWVEWLIDEVLPAIKMRQKEVSTQLSILPDVRVIRQKKRLSQLLQKVEGLLEYQDQEQADGTTIKVRTLQTGWVWTGYERIEKDSDVTVTFKPIKVADYGPGLLWNRNQRFILMSATLISPEQMAEDLGMPEGSWTTVTMPSSFPILSRPIYPLSIASVSNKTKAESIPKIAREVLAICEQHPNDRILVHTVSYQMTREVAKVLIQNPRTTRRVVSYNQAWQRDKALEKYLSQPDSVLLAPSFDRGVDLKDDDCRVVVVAKIPYPYLGDKQVSRRLYSTGKSGKVWYKVQAIRSLCQMTGRGMRSADDWCSSYILDNEFDRLYSENRNLFPSWWKEAIVWDRNDPKWKGVVA